VDAAARLLTAEHSPGAWLGLGVVPAERLLLSSSSSTGAEGAVAGQQHQVPVPLLRRVALTTPFVLALRLSFKGFARGNVERYHGLVKCAVYAEAPTKVVLPLPPRALRATPPVGGRAAPRPPRESWSVPLHTQTLGVLHSLERLAVAALPLTAAAAAASDPAKAADGRRSAATAAAVTACVRALCSLAAASGSLSTLLTLVQVCPLCPLSSAPTRSEALVGGSYHLRD
jgi:hypothetical protein